MRSGSCISLPRLISELLTCAWRIVISPIIPYDSPPCYHSSMRHLFVLFIHLIAVLTQLFQPGGVRSLVAEPLLLAGWMALLIRPTRLLRSAIVLKPSTLLALHKAMCKRKYRVLFSPNRHRKPGPKGPSADLFHLVIEMKQRNPNWGCPRIAQTGSLGGPHPNRQRRSSQDSRPSLPAGTALRRPLLADVPGPHERQPLEHGSVPVRIGYFADPLGPGGHGSIHTPDRWLWRPCGNDRWGRTLSDVQPCHSRATPNAEVSQFR